MAVIVYLLTAFTHLPHRTYPPLATTKIFSASLNLFVYFFENAHASELMWYLSFSDWLISLSVLPLNSFYVVANKIFFSFFLFFFFLSF